MIFIRCYLARASSVLYIMAVVALPGLSLDGHPNCYTSLGAHGVETHHCTKAEERIIYNPNQTLDGVSRSLMVSHKSCVVNVQKPKHLMPTKDTIERMVHNITRACPSTGGVLLTSSNLMVYIYRATDHNTYEINKPRCEKKRCNISLDDCSNAMLALPVNQKGNLIGTEPGYYSANATRGNCTVKVITTDYALLRLTHQEADASFRVLVNECKDHPGDIFINGGTAGYNGDVRISIRGFGNHTCS